MTRFSKLSTYDHRSTTSAILSVLDTLTIQMTDIARDVETSVQTVCNGFKGMGVRARDALTAAADALNASSEGGGLPAFVYRVRMAMLVLLHRVESSREFSSQLTQEMEELTDRLDGFSELSSRLMDVAEETIKTSTRARNELRRRGVADDVMYDVVEDASNLSHTCAHIAQAISSLVLGLNTSLEHTASRLRAKATDDAEASAASESSMQDMLDQMANCYENMSDSLASSATMSRQLNLDIGQAVMALQFQDRVNQRIEHIVDTVRELANDLKPLTTSTDIADVSALTRTWIERLNSKSTMAVERNLLVEEEPAPDSEEGSIELF